MIRETVGHLRDLPRYRQILSTLIRYGYQDVVKALHLEGIVKPIERATLGDEAAPYDRPRRLRLVCEDLGPTFVKLGQVLSTRRDLLPEAYTSELAALRDDVRPFPYEQVQAILTEEYQSPPEVVFASISPVPIASASISQVHLAILHDGRKVALKVRRPELHKIVASDLDILKNLAQLAERHSPTLAVYRPMMLVREFERTIKRELDFSIELRTLQTCRRQFANAADVHIPFVVEEFSTPRVLAMEFIEGVRIDDVTAIRSMGADPSRVAVVGAQILIKQIFQFGLFHADPHPGNLRVLPGGVVALLDFGMFGRLAPRVREQIGQLLIGLMQQDVDRVMKSIDELTVRGEHVDLNELRRDVDELVQTYCDLTLATINLEVLLGELIGLIRRYRLQLPPDLVLLIRALVTTEGTCRALDPKFDIARQLEPPLRRMAAKRYSPTRFLKQGLDVVDDVQKIAMLLPDLLSHSLESIKRGELNVKFDVHGFERLVKQLTRAGNTLAVGIVISGLLVSSSLIYQAGATSLAQIGFGIGLALSLWLIASMTRS